MGWINAAEQQVIRQRFGATSDSVCDGCGKPILGIAYIDPKGGYYPKPSGLPDFLPRQPKKTYCQECDERRRSKKPKKMLKLAQKVLDLLGDRKKKWTTKGIVAVLEQIASEESIREAVLYLKTEKYIRWKEETGLRAVSGRNLVTPV